MVTVSTVPAHQKNLKGAWLFSVVPAGSDRLAWEWSEIWAQAPPRPAGENLCFDHLPGNLGAQGEEVPEPRCQTFQG